MNAPGKQCKPAALTTVGLSKSFGHTVVLDGIDLTVEQGTVFALLGPNGAGKTTMIQILTTLLAADGGAAHVAGLDVAADPDGVRHAIGMTGQFAAVDSLLTGEENLRLMSDLCHLGRAAGRRRVAELLAQFDLVDAARQPPSTYSGGMRRRLDLAMTLVGNPRIIFLDEPTTGLDPRSRHTVWQIIRNLVRDGVTIFLTTQYLDEADQLADRIAVLDGGSIVAEGSPAELKRLVPGGHILLQFEGQTALDRAASALTAGVRDESALTLQVPSDGGISSLRAVLQRLDAEAIDVAELSIHTPDLDDVFLALTGRPDAATPPDARQKELAR
jgi:ABC-2 type transport system ATP-binding protein